MEVTSRLELPPLESVMNQQPGQNGPLGMLKQETGGSQPSEAWAVGQKRPRDEGQIPQPGPQGFMQQQQQQQQQQPHGMISPIYGGPGGYA